MSPYRIQCWYLKNTEMQLQDIGQITSQMKSIKKKEMSEYIQFKKFN